MAITAAKIETLSFELNRMNAAIHELESTVNTRMFGLEEIYDSGRYTAAVRRVSMDLTRALADLRRREG